MHQESLANTKDQPLIHIQSQFALKTIGTWRKDLALNEQRRLNIYIHNAGKVKLNGEIFKDLDNAACFLAKQEPTFHINTLF